MRLKYEARSAVKVEESFEEMKRAMEVEWREVKLLEDANASHHRPRIECKRRSIACVESLSRRANSPLRLRTSRSKDLEKLMEDDLAARAVGGSSGDEKRAQLAEPSQRPAPIRKRLKTFRQARRRG